MVFRLPGCLRAVAHSTALFSLCLLLQGFVYAQITNQSSMSDSEIHGTVRATQGAALSGVQVTILSSSSETTRVSTTDDSGAFVFSGLLPGTYQIRVSGASLEPWVSGDVLLGAGERREVSVTPTGIPTMNTTVDVTATLKDVAEAQVQEEEKQRILGILPNFYSSYRWDALPMTPRLKFKLALRSVLDPFAFVMAAGVAGTEQAHQTFPGYGQGVEGYSKRYGSAYADAVVGRILGSAVFPAVLHQDPRYFYRGAGSIRSRILYALEAAVICRGDNGQLEPNYSHVFGSFSAAGISTLYRASGDRSAGLVFRNGLIITGGSAITNLLREFVARRLSSNVPPQAVGRP
jgi:hypothetical protein